MMQEAMGKAALNQRHINRLKVPRPPRLRPTKDGVQRSSGPSNFSVKPDRAFSDEQLTILASGLSVPGNAREWLFAGLQDIGTTYLRQRAQPETAKSQARYDLEWLAYATAAYLRDPEGPIQLADLRQTIGRMSDRARSYFWVGAVHHPAYEGSNPEAYLTGSAIDWCFVGQAAEIGCSLMTGGRYANLTATIALCDLKTIYETVTGAKATFSRKEIGPTTVSGTRRHVGNSPFCRFAMSVFVTLDPAVKPTWITNKLPQLLYNADSLDDPE